MSDDVATSGVPSRRSDGGLSALRRLALVALALAFAQTVFGAIVRISGSGMGCGDHWPRCQGRWFPPLDQPTLIIEITHRWIAAGLGVAIVSLVVATARRRRVSGATSVGRAAGAAAVLYVTAAVLGAITVKLALNPWVVPVHLAIAMSLLAALALAVLRSTVGSGSTTARDAVSRRTVRGTAAAAGLAFGVLLFGALTANLPGAAAACEGFPLCRNGYAASASIQLVHRGLAFLLLFHLAGLAVGVARRREAPLVVRAARWALTIVLVQLAVAAALVELRLPPALQSLHQAIGTMVWLATFSVAVVARQLRRETERPNVSYGVASGPESGGWMPGARPQVGR